MWLFGTTSDGVKFELSYGCGEGRVGERVHVSRLCTKEKTSRGAASVLTQPNQEVKSTP